MMGRNRALGMVGLAVACGAGPALGQATDGPDIVIVTGEKAERSLQDTVSSVAVVTSRRIEQENIVSLNDIINRTPNLAETYGPTGFTIRGIDNSNVSGGGGSSGLATVYLDGAPLPQNVLYSAPLDMWDIGQVEILRGPQSTLQGRASLAGAVIIRSQEPTWTYDARARVIVSDADDREFAFAGGGPLVDGQLAFRIAYQKREEDGFVYNTTRQADENAVDAESIRGSLLLTPEALPGFSARLTYLHADRSGGYLYQYNRTDVPDYFNNRIMLSDTPSAGDNVADIAVLNLDYDVSDRVSLAAVTSWNQIDTHTTNDADFTALPTSYGEQFQNFETLTQEMRVSYEGERLRGVIGGYYSSQDNGSNGSSLTNVNTPVSTIEGLLISFGAPPAQASFIANLYADALPVVPVDFSYMDDTSIETYALFADGSFALTPRFSLLGGFRYDVERHQMDVVQTSIFAGTYPDPAAYGPPGSPLYTAIAAINMGVQGYVDQASTASPPAGVREFEAFLPKAGLSYDWTDALTTSFVAQRGYRSGGAAVNTARSSVVPYDPEYTWNYEGSLRSEWLDGALTLNANAYYMEWTDQQVSINLGLNDYDTQTVNAGSSHLYGFEAEAAHRLSRNFDWYAGIGYSRTKFDDFVVSVGTTYEDFSGSEFSFAPHWTASAGANYRWNSGFTANINAAYQSEAFSSIGVGQTTRPMVDARIVVNGRFGYEADHWAAYAYVNNIFDEEYSRYTTSIPLAILGAPRVIGVTLEARL